MNTDPPTAGFPLRRLPERSGYSTPELAMRGIGIDPSDGTVLFDIEDRSDTMPFTSNDPECDSLDCVDVERAVDGTLRVIANEG